MQARIGVLLVQVNDFNRMLSFYRDVLGLPLGDVDPGSGHPAPLPRQNAMIVALQVEDIEQAYSELSTRGVTFRRPIQSAQWGRYAHFDDPEGNQLQLCQPFPGY